MTDSMMFIRFIMIFLFLIAILGFGFMICMVLSGIYTSQELRRDALDHALLEQRHQRRLREIEQHRILLEQVAHAAIEYTQFSNEKAKELFESYCSPEQLMDYKRHKYIMVKGSVTKRKYKIDCRHSIHNITCAPIKYCMVSAIDVPLHDTLLAQKLIIECDEKTFLAKANVFHM